MRNSLAKALLNTGWWDWLLSLRRWLAKGMASGSNGRLLSELRDLSTQTIPNVFAAPADDGNIHKWHALILGPAGTPCKGATPPPTPHSSWILASRWRAVQRSTHQRAKHPSASVT